MFRDGIRSTTFDTRPIITTLFLSESIQFLLNVEVADGRWYIVSRLSLQDALGDRCDDIEGTSQLHCMRLMGLTRRESSSIQRTIRPLHRAACS